MMNERDIAITTSYWTACAFREAIATFHAAARSPLFYATTRVSASAARYFQLKARSAVNTVAAATLSVIPRR